ncbi:hypothetical protein LI010_09280, partial [Enterocloster aldenensis]|uniref:hypothetical protein n=1 Tax=Enterocloster aldenensis TaxID=358742 RepID=UPI001D093C46|nr:hypothetical protein [Enterocloster aldenensis]
REMQRDAEEYSREMQGNAGECRGMQRDAERCRGIQQRDAGECREMQRDIREVCIWRKTGR